MHYYLDLRKAFVGQDVAIDPSRNYEQFIFCKVVKVTQNQVHVKPEKEDSEILRFSKVTGRQLGGNSWDKDRSLVSKDTAEARIATIKKRHELNAERNQIKNAFQKLAQGNWSVDTPEEVEALKDRMKAVMEREKEG